MPLAPEPVHVPLTFKTSNMGTKTPRSVPATPLLAPGEPPIILPGTVKAARKRLIEIKRVQADGFILYPYQLYTSKNNQYNRHNSIKILIKQLA